MALLLKEIYSRELYVLPLLREMGMENLADTQYSLLSPSIEKAAWKGKPIDNLDDIIKLAYEIEYKYHALGKKFKGVEERRQNILELLEKIGRRAANILAGTFYSVFKQYIKDHKDLIEYYERKGKRGIKPDRFEKKVLLTYKRIFNFTKILKNLPSLPFEKQMVSINLAKNMAHVGGSMMQWYNEMYGIDKRFFTRMSRQSVDRWNIELREIGVKI